MVGCPLKNKVNINFECAHQFNDWRNELFFQKYCSTPLIPPSPKTNKNKSGYRPPLCAYRLNWARITSQGWWDDWDDTVLQTQDSKFEPWRSETEHATSRSRRLTTILTFKSGWGRNIFCFFQTAETGNRTPNSGVKGSGANHYPRAPALHLPRQETTENVLNSLQ